MRKRNKEKESNWLRNKMRLRKKSTIQEERVKVSYFARRNLFYCFARKITEKSFGGKFFSSLIDF